MALALKQLIYRCKCMKTGINYAILLQELKLVERAEMYNARKNNKVAFHKSKGSFTRCIFFLCICNAENGLCGCQRRCSHGVISSACDALVCAMSHTIRLHTHSVHFRLRFLESLQLVSLGWCSFSCMLLCFLLFANVICLCQNKQIIR